MRIGPLVLIALLAACSSTADVPGPPSAGGAGGGGGAAGGGGSGGSAPDPCALQAERLQQALEATHASLGAPGGAVMAVDTETCGMWLGAAGQADAEEALTSDHLMRIGSITKTYTAATLVDLAGDGALSLDDPLDLYVAGVPDGNVITVRMLLNHTSGIFNYTDDAAFMNAAAQDPMKVYSPQEIVDAAIAHPPSFPPGEGWEYSNTNYTLAGMVIEAVTGMATAEVIRAHTLTPLGLAHTALDGDEPLPGELPVGYGPTGLDVTDQIHPSVPWTAGAMAATVEDVARWGKALYGGQVLDEQELAEMLDVVPLGGGAGYGLGVIHYPPEALAGVSEGLGHSGGIWGFYSDMLYLVADGTIIVVSVNSNQSDTQPYTVDAFYALYPEAR